MNINEKKLLKWWHNKSINPFTNRKITVNKKKWKSLLKLSILNNVMKDTYDKYHGNRIDPLLKIDLEKNIKVYKYKYCWDPLNGEKLGEDPRGNLYFDPDILIHYYYINRLKYLWVKSNDGYSGTYGEGVGIGPDFYIPGRGVSYHWYLFRLPMFNAYCDLNKIGQQTTLSPILDFNEIEKIYNLALKNKDRYYKLFGKKRPDLIKIYKLYHVAIQKPNYSIKLFTENEIKETYTAISLNAINKLKTIL